MIKERHDTRHELIVRPLQNVESGVGRDSGGHEINVARFVIFPKTFDMKPDSFHVP